MPTGLPGPFLGNGAMHRVSPWNGTEGSQEAGVRQSPSRSGGLEDGGRRREQSRGSVCARELRGGQQHKRIA